jgi:hypothetical protein
VPRHERDRTCPPPAVVSLRGSCLCGAVRFEISQPLERVSQCHCTTCKRISGGVGTVSGRVQSEAISILAGEDLLRTYQPAEGTAKTFCSVCGSNLFGAGWPASEHASVRLSAIEGSVAEKPASHIFVRSVAAWETLPDDGAPRFDALPPA